MNDKTLTRTDEVTKGYYNELVTFFKASKEGAENEQPQDGQAHNLVHDTVSFYDTALSVLQSISGERFGDPTVGQKLNDGFSKAVANVSGVFSGLGDHDDSKTIRDLYAALNAGSCGLQMLYATEVSGYGKSTYSAQLLSLANDMHNLVMKYNQTIPRVVVKELNREEDGAFSPALSSEIVSDLQDTWDKSSGTYQKVA